MSGAIRFWQWTLQRCDKIDLDRAGPSREGRSFPSRRCVVDVAKPQEIGISVPENSLVFASPFGVVCLSPSLPEQEALRTVGARSIATSNHVQVLEDTWPNVVAKRVG
jgi:hypothetical protein